MEWHLTSQLNFDKNPKPIQCRNEKFFRKNAELNNHLNKIKLKSYLTQCTWSLIYTQLLTVLICAQAVNALLSPSFLLFLSFFSSFSPYVLLLSSFFSPFPLFFLPSCPFSSFHSDCLPNFFPPFLYSAFLNCLIFCNDHELFYTINRNNKFLVFYTGHSSKLLQNWNIQRDTGDLLLEHYNIIVFVCLSSLFNQVFNRGQNLKMVKWSR